MDDSTVACIDMCNECADACDRCASLSLRGDDAVESIRLALECAALCRTGASLTSRESRYSKGLLALCVLAAGDCAQACDRHDDDHHRACAEICRHFVSVCHRSSTHGRAVSNEGAILPH